MATLPIFDPATPKVSILAIGKGTLASANELLLEAEQQALKFMPQATEKAEFMGKNYDFSGLGQRVTKCTLANATGTRLELIGAEGLASAGNGTGGPPYYYEPPPILEPGAVASFLFNKDSKEFALKYTIQVFQGPGAPLPIGGWTRVEDSRAVTLSLSKPKATIKSDVQVMDGMAPARYPTQITFEVNDNGDLGVQISAKQVITQTPLPPG